MSEQRNIDDRLWDYIDGSCGEDEKRFVEELIATQQEWRDKYGELLGVHQLMQQSIDLDEPSLRFTRNVMEGIALHHIAPATKSYIDKKIINGIGLFFLVSMVGFLVYGVSQISWSGSGISNDLFAKYTAPKVEWSRYLNGTSLTIFMMVNVVLGLVLLDMYLGKKKKQAKV